ncbi:hypothetical protein Tsubulata_038205 [Turnera subulata]|uniref:DUF632 domain-containing protein n=1 Tax=Turnera subulata TaxID=218843 RepID=A0A9Q0J180_9ROSI|nr:hypothetical protein Tsubulata_038205 [Turnera subulata]
MGCSTSRIDQLPAVSLCHDRVKFLQEALHHSHLLADAHLAYLHSLNSLGPTLHNFFHHQETHIKAHNNNSTDTNIPEAKRSSLPHDDSDSESHIEFPSSDSDDENGKKDFDDKSSQGVVVHSSYRYTHSGSYSSYRDHPKYDEYEDNGESAWITPSPPAPTNSAWDFLNFFEPYERYELPTRNKEDQLQDGKSEEKKVSKDDEKVERNGEEVKTKQVRVGKKISYKDAVSEKGKNKDHKGTAVEPGDDQNVLEIMKEVEVMFQRIAGSGNEVLKVFDAGKLRYYHKNSVYQGSSSKMMHVVLPAFSKAQEKMRVIYVKNCKQMKIMGEKGGDANKIESAGTSLRALSTRIRVAIKVIDKISVTINKLRDEELWPQISDLIQRLLDMWKVMLECHRCQSQAIEKARSMDAAIASNEKFSDSHLEATIQLRKELHNWNMRFSNWITAQRNYIQALNAWLVRCLPSEPEEMPDTTSTASPPSPGRPPVFVICNQWSDSMKRFSEMEVIEAMHGFFAGVNQLLNRHFLYLQQSQSLDKDTDRKMKRLEREGQRMQKLMQGRQRKLYLTAMDSSGVAIPGRAVHQSDIISNVSFQLGLKQIFMAMEKLSSDTVQKYEELHMRIEEEKTAKENPEASNPL